MTDAHPGWRRIMARRLKQRTAEAKSDDGRGYGRFQRTAFGNHCPTSILAQTQEFHLAGAGARAREEREDAE